MRQSFLVLLIASGCGGGSSPSGDYADAFVGLWTGTVTIRTTTQGASMPISRTGTNAILRVYQGQKEVHDLASASSCIRQS